MRVLIHAHQLAAPRDLRLFLAKHFVRPLRRLHDSPATELTLYVADAKPGRGGQDQACMVTFRMPGARTLRVESIQEDLHAALLECGHRLRRLVQRELAKARGVVRAPMHKPLGRAWRERMTRAGIAPDGTP